ncbi:cobalt ABC transporter permease [Kiloniella laminariae]|uniref:Cobalt ABC transporter permease n=1 Tax=Kiloniella laminariae TaxID=454162 RepID=A0ABT4LPG9_9PROT|nr:cobalt ABC transporter permease [Kiloniella laminariae]MCZ4283025.1 cobalt ABC transporter permease [Kiloniella laminariae]
MPFDKTRLSGLCLALFLGVTTVSSAWAHKIISAAYPDGNKIEGEIGFSNGDMAANVLVIVSDVEGNKLGEVTTDEEGFFTFVTTTRVDHHFRADLSAGHIASFVVTADELPETLEGEKSLENEIVTEGPGDTVNTGMAPVAASASVTAGTMMDEELFKSIVGKEVSKLRKELALFKEERRFQDILGGIGYILGIFGIASFLLGRRKPVKDQ